MCVWGGGWHSPAGVRLKALPRSITEVPCWSRPVVREQAHVFGLGATLFIAADFSLAEDEEPSLSAGLPRLWRKPNPCFAHRVAFPASGVGGGHVRGRRWLDMEALISAMTDEEVEDRALFAEILQVSTAGAPPLPFYQRYRTSASASRQTASLALILR